ncbi:Fpg/Nei family DNA glycosylase [Streptomyces sp. NBC_01186]|uniref:Fpg/Nei family DNA glycosylase n=1 Tax=unclassified Streptomyces TaxID=2593676 RepID=UPI002DD7DD40|nr:MULTISPECIES: DNA-formamidopyrimidine glycosylase family protein [unclassified Streptomyces]WSB77888.1 Fpg/Nei family DNA glycosylase [Streptomyces sp. NBC_01775]WSS13854.1 Fpg/Nei family DNA glycosylase [Streptomyces sp. NBC_01186]
MPELPDVEGFRRVLADCAQGRTIQRIEVRDTGVLHGVSPRQLRDALEGRRFGVPERRGKWLLARTGGPTLLLHFGMTGKLVCSSPDEPFHAHDRVVLTLGKRRQLRYRDQRKLKGLWLADETGVAELLGSQGPDALTVSRRDFDHALTSHRRALKSALTDQSAVAGLGNLLADEILWQSHQHPARRTTALTGTDIARLHKDMRQVLRTSSRAERVPPKSAWLTGHRDEKDPTCPRCGTPLCRTRTAGRSTVWCPRCQPPPG